MRQKKPQKRYANSLNTRFSAIVSIALPLFILGWIGVVESAQQGLDREMREGLTFTLNLEKKVTDEQALLLLDTLKTHPYLKDARYISPKEAAQELEKELGENPELVLGYNPLLPSVELHLKAVYTHPDSLPKVDSMIASLHGVDRLSYRADMFSTVHKRMNKIAYGLLVLTLLLFVIALIQINNTTQIMIYTKRFLIRSMSLLGAKHGLICRPFIGYSIGNGFLGSLLSLALFAGSLWAGEHYLQLSILHYTSWAHLAIIAIALVVIGIVLSSIAAFFATRRYIRMDRSRIVLS